MSLTCNPTKAGLSVPGGTLRLGRQLDSARGIVNGAETFAPTKLLSWICSMAVEELGKTKRAGIWNCSIRLIAVLMARSGGNTQARPSHIRRPQSCTNA